MFLYSRRFSFTSFFYFTTPSTSDIYSLSLHDALPISLCIVSSVYFPSCSLCASSGSTTLTFTPPLNQERYHPEESVSPITNSSRYARLPVTNYPVAKVTLTAAGASAGPLFRVLGYRQRCNS